MYIRPNASPGTPFGFGPLEVAFDTINNILQVAESTGNVAATSAHQSRFKSVPRYRGERSATRDQFEASAFHDLLCDPIRCWMPRHCNVEDLSVSESDDEEDVKRLEQDRRDAEKVAGPNVRCMPRQELSPRAGWAPAAMHSHILATVLAET
jgi:hypothetical protein